MNSDDSNNDKMKIDKCFLCIGYGLLVGFVSVYSLSTKFSAKCKSSFSITFALNRRISDIFLLYFAIGPVSAVRIAV